MAILCPCVHDSEIWGQISALEERLFDLAPWGAKITLIKATLAVLPIYYLSVFKIPPHIGKRLEQIHGNFLRSNGEAKGTQNIKWSIVCEAPEFGSIGIGRVKVRKLALLGNWLWRFRLDESLLWMKVMKSINSLVCNGCDAISDPKASWWSSWRNTPSCCPPFDNFVLYLLETGKEPDSGYTRGSMTFLCLTVVQGSSPCHPKDGLLQDFGDAFLSR